MATQFAPVELATIKQGDFLQLSEDNFQQLQAEFIKYIEENKISADAELTMKVKLHYEKSKESCSIITQIEKKLPKLPATVTSAFVGEKHHGGQKCLFAQAAGATEDNPRQTKLCTDSGEVIDLGTGKAKR